MCGHCAQKLPSFQTAVNNHILQWLSQISPEVWVHGTYLPSLGYLKHHLLVYQNYGICCSLYVRTLKNYDQQIYLSTYLFIYLSIYLSICLSIHLLSYRNTLRWVFLA